jgi:predicted HicB family RNase H-like nuclease
MGNDSEGYLGVRIDKRLKYLLELAAAEEGVSVSDYVRRVLWRAVRAEPEEE